MGYHYLFIIIDNDNNNNNNLNEMKYLIEVAPLIDTAHPFDTYLLSILPLLIVNAPTPITCNIINIVII